ANYELKLSEDEAEKWRTWRQNRDVVRPHKNETKQADTASENGSDTNGESEKSDDPWQDDPQLRRAIEYIESKIKEGGARAEIAAWLARTQSPHWLPS